MWKWTLAAACGVIIGAGCFGSDDAARNVLQQSDVETSLDCPTAAPDQAAVTSTYLEVLYPDAGQDDAIACSWGSLDCSVQITHLSTPPAGPPPTIAACRSGAAPLGACYAGAVQRTLTALDQGDAAMLYEGAVRTRDVTVRAGNTSSGPPWLRSFAPTNLLAKLFTAGGVPIDSPLPACANGTTDQRYFCLSNASRGQFRGLLGLLDHHAGVLARTGNTAGASELAWKIFESATAPTHARIVNTGQVSPTAGIRMNRVDLLGKYEVLRLLDGTAQEGDATELAELVTRQTYMPSSPGDAAPLFVPRFDILLAGASSLRWDETQHKPIDTDPTGAADLRALWRTVSHGITLAALQGKCTLGQELQDVRYSFAALFSAKNMRAIPVEGTELATIITWDTGFHDLLVALDIVQGRACGWITSEDYVEGWAEVSYWYEYESWDDCEEGPTSPNGPVIVDCHPCEDGEVIDGVECECDLVTYCVKHNIFGACTEEYSFEDCGYLVEYSSTSAPTRVADALTFVTSLRGAYRDLMAYYDTFSKVNGAWVKNERDQGDGVYDLHYNPVSDTDATIALSYVDGEQCTTEIGQVEAAFGSTGQLTCSPGDICDDPASALFPPGSWIPFPIATRLCPETAGTFGGVLADDGSESWCATPWDFTKAVAHDWLPLADDVITAVAEQDALDGMHGDGTWQAEDGEDLTSTLVEFFAETNLLSEPIAAMYLRKAQVAYSAGYLPNLANNQFLTSETLGLDTIEGHVDTGLEVMSKDFDLMLDFYNLEDNSSTSSSPLQFFYDRPIPRLALSAMEDLYGSTVTNDYTSNRAMIYPRLGDALELYRQLVRLKLEVLWRRADGFNACIDTGVCDPTAATGCAEYCVHYDDAIAFTESASSELDAIDDMLADHAFWINTRACPFGAAAVAPGTTARIVGTPQTCFYDDPADLEGYIGRMRDHIAGTKDELARSAASMEAGNDAFGFRGIDQYPGGDIETRIDDLVATVLAMGYEYEGFIDDYLSTLSSYTDFAASVASAATTSSGLIAAYCVDANGVEQPGGCAVDKTTWTSSTAPIADINASLSAILCVGELTDSETGEHLSIALDQIDDAGYAELSGMYEDFLATLGLSSSTCPQLVAPDFAAWDGYGGALAEDLISMKLILGQLSGQLSTYQAQLAAAATQTEVIHVIQMGVDEANADSSEAQSILAGLTCIGTIVATVLTDGATAFPAITACSEFLSTSISASSADTLDELHLELESVFAGYQNLQLLMADIIAIYNTLLQYEAAVQSFEAHRAQFLNLQNNIQADYRNLYTNAFKFDPTNLLFSDEQVASMALRYRSAMSDVRELEILVGYDLGAPLSEGQGIYLENDYYFLPRLADITVAESYGLADESAYLTLNGTTRPLDERDVTLVSVAAMLNKIHDTAGVLGGGESMTHGFLSESNASGFDANGYPESYTEWSLLRRSPFYNAWIASDPSADDDGDGIPGTPCGIGEIDLYHYCKNSEGTPMGPENNCLAVTSLDERTRLNLAWLDHQIVGIGANVFACTATATGYSIAPAVGTNGIYLDIEELNPHETRDDVANFDWYLPDFMETGTLTGDETWYRGQVSQAFYDSQTPTVRQLMDAVFDMADRGVVSIHTKTFMPGSYLFGIHASDSANPDAVYDSVVNDYDLEDWGLIGSTGASETFAERLKDISLMCTDVDTCAGSDRDGSNAVEAHYARFFYSGPGYQSSVCTGPVHQEKVAWVVDDRTTQGSFAIKSTDPDAHQSDAEWMSSRVADPTVSIKAGELDDVPLQATLAVIQVFGLTDSDGNSVSNPWVLHADYAADEVPNLRLALHYRYYKTEIDTNAQWSEAEGQQFYESVTSCSSPASTYPWP